MKDKDVIKFNPNGGGADFVMDDRARSAWISIGEISLYILKTDDGVRFEAYPKGHEGGCCDALAESEAKECDAVSAQDDHEA